MYNVNMQQAASLYPDHYCRVFFGGGGVVLFFCVLMFLRILVMSIFRKAYIQLGYRVKFPTCSGSTELWSAPEAYSIKILHLSHSGSATSCVRGSRRVSAEISGLG